jgi:two-component system chemotaxis response regulator CheY
MATRILVIDDDLDLLEMATALLELSGYAVDVARDGEEGWRCLAARRPALILLDLRMPGVDARRFIERLRQAPELPPPVVLMSGWPTLAREARALGAQAFLSKPFDPEQLLQAIERTLGPPVREGA